LVVSVRSRHSIIAFVATFALHGLPRRTLLFGLLALLICWSRIFVGTHYLTDILGGSLTGAAAAMLVWVFYREGSRLDRFATGIL
jgi:undecaprenyl-diphosphatase